MTYDSIFQVRVDGVYYTTPRSYSEQEFEDLMSLVEWRMPYGMHAYHYHPEDIGGKGMAIIKARPVLDLDVQQLFSNCCAGQMNMMSREGCVRKPVLHKASQHLLVQSDDAYARYTLFDPAGFWLVARYGVVPLPFKAAREFVNSYHRHNVAPPAHKFSIGLKAGNELVGVVIASRPISRHRDDGYTLEINRCCVLPGYKNACSKLIGHAVRAGVEMGYRKFVSYTLVSEPGSSLLASGFTQIGITKDNPNGWNNPSRPRKKPARYPEGPKNVWMREISHNKEGSAA